MIDLSDLDGARIVQTTGQSGNPFDSHYGDLIDDWATGANGAAALLSAVDATVAAPDAHPVDEAPATFVRRCPYALAGRRPYSSLIGSGPSGTSMRTRPSSTTTG